MCFLIVDHAFTTLETPSQSYGTSLSTLKQP